MNAQVTNNYRLNIVATPSIEPVTLEEVKDHLKETSTDNDSILTALIISARQSAEMFTGRAFITQTWQMFMNYFSRLNNSSEWWDGVRERPISFLNKFSDDIEIPIAPLQSIAHIKIYDDEDTAVTFDSSNYFVSFYDGLYARNGRVTLREGSTWPTVDRVADGIEIQFIAGYGDLTTDVPESIRQAIMQEVAFLFENRGECSVSSVNSETAKSLLNPFRIRQSFII